MSIISGYLIFNEKPGEPWPSSLNIGFQGHWLERLKDNFGDSAIKILLTKAKILEKDILHAYAKRDSKVGLAEIFFVYKTRKTLNPKDLSFFYANNSSVSQKGFIEPDGLIIPKFSLIKKDWKKITLDIIKKHKVKSFRVLPLSIPTLPKLILAQNLKGGNIADMRNIKNSYKYVNSFKSLDYNNIWYINENGSSFNIKKPPTGWLSPS